MPWSVKWQNTPKISAVIPEKISSVPGNFPSKRYYPFCWVCPVIRFEMSWWRCSVTVPLWLRFLPDFLSYCAFSTLWRFYRNIDHQSGYRIISARGIEKTVSYALGNRNKFSSPEVYGRSAAVSKQKGGVCCPGDLCQTDHVQLLWMDYLAHSHSIKKQ